MNNSIKRIEPLQLPWATEDPYIFCAYHRDLYPAGNESLGPAESLQGRRIGQDFAGKDGWNMYHGKEVPGFPAHPHRGFETVTVVTEGLVDHSDSLGSAGRFGNGDVQWLTSGKGVQHAEMFPLLSGNQNHFELFQIWLNLPRKDKMAPPHYKMLWREDIPLIEVNEGGKAEIRLIAGYYEDHKALDPTRDSWAADPANDMQIWTVRMEPGAKLTLPAPKTQVNRSVYFYKGSSLNADGQIVEANHRIVLDGSGAVELTNGDAEGYFLLLQGKPIAEPVVQYGPFVMNSRDEIQEAFDDYQADQFGGWPWKSLAPTHGKEQGRFALHADGKREEKG